MSAATKGRKSLTAKGANPRRNRYSLTAKDPKDAEENNSFTAKEIIIRSTARPEGREGTAPRAAYKERLG
jgi:hypothetical protein